MYRRAATTGWRAVLIAGVLCLLGLSLPVGGQEAGDRPAKHGAAEKARGESRSEAERATAPQADHPPKRERPRERVATGADEEAPAAVPEGKPGGEHPPEPAAKPHRESESAREGERHGAREERETPRTEAAEPGTAQSDAHTPSPLPAPVPDLVRLGAPADSGGSPPGGPGGSPAPAAAGKAPAPPATDAPTAAQAPASVAVPRTSPSRREAQVLKSLGALRQDAAAAVRGKPAGARAEQELANRVSLWIGELRAEAAKASRLLSDMENDRRRLLSQQRSLPWHVRQGRISRAEAEQARDGLWEEQARYNDLYDRLVTAAEAMAERLSTYEAAMADARRLGLSKALLSDLQDAVGQARSIQRDLRLAADTAVANAKTAGEVLARLLPAMRFARTQGVLWRTEARLTISTVSTAVRDLRALAATFPEATWDMATVDTEVSTEGAQAWVLGLVAKLIGILALGGGLVWLGRRLGRAAAALAARQVLRRADADAETLKSRWSRGLEAIRAALAFAFMYGAVRILPLSPRATLVLTYLVAAWCAYSAAQPLLRLYLAPRNQRVRLVQCDDGAAGRLLNLLRLALMAAAVFLPLIHTLAILDYPAADVILGLKLLYGLATTIVVLLLANARGGPLCLISAGDPQLAAALRNNAYLINPAISLTAVTLLVAAAGGYINLAAYVARGVLYSLILFAVLWHAHRRVRSHIEDRLPALEGDPETHAQRRSQLLRFVACWGEGLAVAATAVFGALYSWGIRGYHLHQVLDYLSVPLLDIKGAKVSVLGLVWGLLVVALSAGVARITRDNVRNAQTFRDRWDPGARHAIASLLYYGIVVGGFVVGILVAGMQLGVLTAFAGLVGVAVGFGSQDIAKNTICGLIIMLDGSINVGDFVDVAGQSGTIVDTNIRSTTISTPDGRKVVVPNATFYTQNVVVSSRREARVRVTVDVNLAPETDLGRARAVILGAAAQAPGVLRTPEPEVLFKALAAAALNLQVVAWTDRIEQVPLVQQRLMSQVWEAVRAEGLKLA